MLYFVSFFFSFVFFFNGLQNLSAQNNQPTCLLAVRSMEEALSLAYDHGKDSYPHRTHLPPSIRQILETVGGEVGPIVPSFQLNESAVVADSSSAAVAAKRGLAVVAALAQMATHDMSVRVDGLGIARDRDDVDRDRDRSEATYRFNTWIRIINPSNSLKDEFSSTPFRIAGADQSTLDRNLDDLRYALEKASETSNARARLVIDRREYSRSRPSAEVRIEVRVQYDHREVFRSGVPSNEDIAMISPNSMDEALKIAHQAGYNSRPQPHWERILSHENVGAIIGRRVPVYQLNPSGVVADSSSRALAATRGLAVVSALMGQAPTDQYSLLVDGRGLSNDRDDFDRDGDRREMAYHFDTWFRVLEASNQRWQKFQSTPFRISGSDRSILQRNLDDLRYALESASETRVFEAKLIVERTSARPRPNAEVHIEFIFTHSPNRKVLGPGLQTSNSGRDDW